MDSGETDSGEVGEALISSNNQDGDATVFSDESVKTGDQRNLDGLRRDRGEGFRCGVSDYIEFGYGDQDCHRCSETPAAETVH